MLRVLALVALVASALACGPLASPTLTATAVPTQTPRPTVVPTDTPPPTVAPTRSPTATATLPPATPTASPIPAPVTLKIISDLPMTGNSLVSTRTIVNAEKLRLEQANSKACGGKYRISFEAWDDASAALGKWDPAVETENAIKAAADPSTIVYLGTYNSGASKLSIPILNEKGPLVMISPANTYPGLTKPGKGLAGEPDKYYPSGVRNYARVVSASDVQGIVAARFVHDQLGAKTVFILDDQQQYGQLTADAFEAAANKIGLKVLGRSSIDPQAKNYTTLMNKISVSNGGKPPDAIYFGLPVANHAAQLLKDKVAAMGNNTKVKVIGPDGIQAQSFIDDAGASVAAGVYATLAGLPIDQLPPAGQRFYADYATAYGPTNDPYAANGYEAMSIALKAIEDVCAAGGDPTDRRAVRDAVFNIKDFDGTLGTWSFDANGDTTLTDMTLYQIIGGIYQPAAVSRADKITTVK